MSNETAQPAATAPEYQDDENPAVQDGWKVDSISSADWALARIASLEMQMEQNKAILAERIAEARDRTKKLNESLERGVRFFRAHLAVYASTNRDALLGGGKGKTRKLLHGYIQFKKAGGDLKLLDEKALLAWAREQPVELEFVRIIEEPAISEIKAHFKTTGEVPDGMELQPEREDVVISAEPKVH